MRNLAIIPARSGSKGLKDKNIKMLNGKPLLAYTIEAAIESALFQEVMVSTDSDEYAAISMQWGASIPFLRSKELASDTTSSWAVVKDVIQNYKNSGQEFETVALLQPTSPLRRKEDIVNGYMQLNTKDANAIVAVCEVEHSPLWCNTLPENNSMVDFIDDQIRATPRQHMPTFYRINGALFILKTEYLMSTESIYKDKCFALVMPKRNSIDIDDENDFKIAEIMMREQ